MYSPIKWNGAKNKYAEYLVGMMKPAKIYYEPFLGGGAVLLKALEWQLFKEYIVSDVNPQLVYLWNLIRLAPHELVKSYSDHWLKLRRDSDYYYKVRYEFNLDKDPLKYFFLARTCINGLIRTNKKGQFNSSLQKGSIGIQPNNLEKFVTHASYLLTRSKVEISARSYTEVDYNSNSFIYFDPPQPYAVVNGVVFKWGKFISLLIELNGKDYNYGVTIPTTPKDNVVIALNETLYEEEYKLYRSGHSKKTGKRMIKSKESFYINFKTKYD